MTEIEAYCRFCRWRWPKTNGEPHCCAARKVYRIPTRERFQCAGCGRQFSATTGTLFAYRKAPFVTIMRALDMLKDGRPALAMPEPLCCQYRTAWLLAKRIIDSGMLK